MSGIGETVKYYKKFKQRPLTPADRQELETWIKRIIGEATLDITIIALVRATTHDLISELEATKRAFDSTIDQVAHITPREE